MQHLQLGCTQSASTKAFLTTKPSPLPSILERFYFLERFGNQVERGEQAVKEWKRSAITQLWQEPLILTARKGRWAFPPFPDGAESRMLVQEAKVLDGLGL